jgi:endoglucanase
MRFSSLLLGAVTFSGVFSAPAANADLAPNERDISINKKRSNFWFAGVNESGAEFGSGNLPGTKGTDYTWPLKSSVDVRNDASEVTLRADYLCRP